MSTTNKYPYFAPDGYGQLDAVIRELNPTKTFLLVDSNTVTCLPAFVGELPSLAADFEILEIEPGEESKDLEVAAGLWQTLLEYGADRKSLMINIGGGVVCDLGGFVAAAFKRGIPFIHVPTSLLSMVDASVGGKTGINFAGLKNQIGTFTPPEAVLIDPKFLETLPAEEWSSGHGEMVKHALLSGEHWPGILFENRTSLGVERIEQSVAFKHRIVEEDFKEGGLRKVLNLGHTFGHALESLKAAQGQPISHGAAVLQGLHVALALSELDDVRKTLSDRYPWEPVAENLFDALWELQLADKKNEDGAVQFILLEAIGAPEIGVEIDKDQWKKALYELNAGWEKCLRY